MKANKSLLLYLFPLILLFLVCIVRSPSRPLSDFAGYYFGGKALLQGNFMGAYDMETLNFNISAQGHKGVFVSYAPFPPFTSLVFAPFIWLPVSTAKLVFNLISALVFGIAVFRSARFFNIPAHFLSLIPIIFFTPIVNNLYFGQGYLLLLALLLEGFLAYRKQNLILSSLFWGFAILFKLFPAVIFFYLLLRKEYKNTLYLVLACSLFFLLSLLMNGVDVWQNYFNTILPKLNAGELNDPFTISFQSAFMLCKKAFVYDALLNPFPVLNSQLLFAVLTGLFKAVLLSFAVVFTIKNRDLAFKSFAVWLFTSMLVSPNGSSYSLILLLIPFFAFVRQQNVRRLYVLTAIVLLFVVCNIRIQWFSTWPLLLQFPRLYLLLLIFVLLIWHEREIVKIRLIIGLSILFIVPKAFAVPALTDNSSYLLREEKDLFIYDFTARNGKLVYWYWDGFEKERMTECLVQSLSHQGVSILNKQIFLHGKQLTVTPDMKKHAALMNGRTIIYLSDKNRGINFYTLRKIELIP